MITAIFNGKVIAGSDQTIVVEGNHYFPPQSVKRDFLTVSETHTVCPWKGVASYYDIQVDGQVNRGAAWYCPNTSKAAEKIINHVAFWRGVKVVDRQAG